MKIIRNGMEFELTNEEMRQVYEAMHAHYLREDIMSHAEEMEIELSDQTLGQLVQIVDQRLNNNDSYWGCYCMTIEDVIEDNVEKCSIKNMELLARDIYNWCVEHELWGDIIIYFDGKAWSSSPIWCEEKGKIIAEDLYEYENRNPLDYFEYANPNTLSMSFEGYLNHVLNGYSYGWVKLEAEFAKLFEKHGFYYEMGHSWNLSAYEI